MIVKVVREAYSVFLVFPHHSLMIVIVQAACDDDALLNYYPSEDCDFK